MTKAGKVLKQSSCKNFSKLDEALVFPVKKGLLGELCVIQLLSNSFLPPFNDLLSRKRVWIVLKINSLHVKHYMNIVFTFFS